MTKTDRVRAALERGIELLEPFEESGLLGNEALNLHREALSELDGCCIVGIGTLKWWRELVDLNPQDLAPRIDSMLAPYVKGGTE